MKVYVISFTEWDLDLVGTVYATEEKAKEALWNSVKNNEYLMEDYGFKIADDIIESGYASIKEQVVQGYENPTEVNNIAFPYDGGPQHVIVMFGEEAQDEFGQSDAVLGLAWFMAINDDSYEPLDLGGDVCFDLHESKEIYRSLRAQLETMGELPND